jgi:hypothetical protein
MPSAFTNPGSAFALPSSTLGGQVIGARPQATVAPIPQNNAAVFSSIIPQAAPAAAAPAAAPAAATAPLASYGGPATTIGGYGGARGIGGTGSRPLSPMVGKSMVVPDLPGNLPYTSYNGQSLLGPQYAPSGYVTITQNADGGVTIAPAASGAGSVDAMGVGASGNPLSPDYAASQATMAMFGLSAPTIPTMGSQPTSPSPVPITSPPNYNWVNEAVAALGQRQQAPTSPASNPAAMVQPAASSASSSSQNPLAQSLNANSIGQFVQQMISNATKGQSLFE